MIKYDSQCKLIEENTHNLSPALLQEINKIAQTEGYIMHSIETRNIVLNGEDYLSILKEVDIKGKTDFIFKEMNLFIKQCLRKKEDSVLPPRDIILRELFVYTDLAKVLDELQNEFKLPEEEKYIIVKCYNDDKLDALILENMAKQAFKTYNRIDVMPLEAIELSLKMIAKFHAFSMVLKHYRPDYYENKIKNWKNPFNFEQNENFCKDSFKISIDVLEDDMKKKIEMRTPDLINKYYCYIRKNESKTKCLIHGDFRMNNILVKEVGGEPTRAIPVDYQILHYGPPVIDIINLIFISASQEIRATEMENLKNVYFASLKKFLHYFNIDVESVYPYTEFENDFKNQLDYGLLVSLVYLPFILASKYDIPECSNDVKIKIKLHDNFKPRIQGIVEDFIRWGYL